MNASEPETPWIDPDDAPELDERFFREAAVYEGGRLIRPAASTMSGAPLEPVTLSLPRDVVAAFRARGPAWHAAMAEVLRAHAASVPARAAAE